MQRKNTRSALTDLRVEYSTKSMSGWGGLVLMSRFMKRLRVDDFLAAALADGRTSNNQVPVVDMAKQLMTSVLMGGSRFEHVERIRCDEVVKRTVEARRFGSASALTRYFGHFTAGQSEHLHRTVNSLILSTLKGRQDILDLDSTVFTRYGTQEGSKRGYNPFKRGAHSHQPLLGMLATTKIIAHSWLRSGDANPHRGVREFLLELLAQLPEEFSITAVRGDSGFYSRDFMSLLEQHELDYAIKVKMSRGFTSWCSQLDTEWIRFGDKEITEAIYRSPKTHVSRRAVIVRILKQRHVEGVLFPWSSYEYEAVMTSLTTSPAEVWRFYQARGDCENRIKELKHDFHADGFCLQSFNGTEATFRLICFTFNLVALFKATVLRDRRTTLGTIRTKVFVIGAALGTSGREQVLRLGLRGTWKQEFDKLLVAASTCMGSTAAQLSKLLNVRADDGPTPWQLRVNPMAAFVSY